MTNKDEDQHKGWLQELKTFQETELDNRERAREADQFILDPDGQWQPDIARRLDSARRPRMTFDQTTPAIEFIMADIEDMDFGVNVKPLAGDANKDDAELREGMIRTIEANSDATSIYRDAARRMIRRGFDAWIVRSKYTDSWCFDQDLAIENVSNAINRVWLEDTSTNPDSSDCDTGYVLTSLSPTAYKKQFPKGEMKSVDDGYVKGDDYSSYQPEVVVIGERYYRKETMIEVAQLSNGEVVEIDDKFKSIVDELGAKGITVARTKTIKDFNIYHRFFDGGGYLSEEKRTPFKSMPIVTVYGNYELQGNSSKITYSGMVQKLMDYQRSLNYAKSREIEEGALAPRTKFWMTKKQAKGHEAQLQRMNVSAEPVQFYNPDPEAPQPYQTGANQINPHLNQLSQDMSVGIQVSAGVNNAMNGQNAGRMSEEALRMQIDRGVGATRKWVNALVKGIRRTGEILVEAMPTVYDTKRVFQITGIDGTEKQVTLNEEVYDNESGQMVQLNSLSKGKYKVFCDAGPAFANKMEAGIASMLEYASIDPTIMQIGGDVMLKAVDAPLIGTVAERKRAMMLQQGMIPQSEWTEEEAAQMQAAAQQPKEPDASMIMAQAELLKGQADMQEQQNRATELQLQAGKVQADAQAKIDKLESETALNVAKLQQGQQKIDDDFVLKATELEIKANQDLNKQISDNKNI